MVGAWTYLYKTCVHEYSRTQRIQSSANDTCCSAPWVIKGPDSKTYGNSKRSCESIDYSTGIQNPSVVFRKLHIGEPCAKTHSLKGFYWKAVRCWCRYQRKWYLRWKTRTTNRILKSGSTARVSPTKTLEQHHQKAVSIALDSSRLYLCKATPNSRIATPRIVAIGEFIVPSLSTWWSWSVPRLSTSLFFCRGSEVTSIPSGPCSPGWWPCVAIDSILWAPERSMKGGYSEAASVL